MITAPQDGPSPDSTIVLEASPRIAITQRAMVFAKRILREFEDDLREPAYIILARVEMWEFSIEQEELRPGRNLGWDVSMGGNPFSAISEAHRQQLNVHDGVPFVVLAETLLHDEFISGTVIDLDETTNRLIQLQPAPPP